MPEGGVIEVHARKIGERIEITVRDEGPGIPAEILDEIFRPHVTTRASGGGLGLHIVETIVKQNDGRVRAANRRDRRVPSLSSRCRPRSPSPSMPFRSMPG
jgi:signal transduction histidine kinase